MSYQDGMAAINLEMPDRIPRTEYSATEHWELISKVTSIEINENTSLDIRKKATVAFMKEWNYDFYWSTLIGASALDKCRTKMGHASYAAYGADYNPEVSCPFDDPETALDFDPWDVYGSINISEATGRFEKHYRSNTENFGDMVNMTGVYITCISGLIEIFGWDMLLMAMGIDSKAFGEMTDRYVSWIGQYFEALAKSNVPVVMVHDDMVWTEGAIFHPDWYKQYVFPNYKRLFAPLIESGKKIMFTSDGNFTEFIDDIADCGVNGFVLEPMTDMQYIADKYGKTHSFIGNADTRVLLSGTKDDIYNEVKRCMHIGKKCPGFIMAVGNHIPANTPVDNALYYNEVYEKMSRR